MTGHDPRDLERALNDYVDETQDAPTPGFPDWVMRSVESEPLSRRGLLATLGLRPLSAPQLRAVQLAAAALLLVAALGGAAVVGGLLEDEPIPIPTPSLEASPTALPSPTETPSPTPTAAPTPTPAESPDDDLDSPDPDETPEPGETPDSD
jgi:hypothetical protein